MAKRNVDLSCSLPSTIWKHTNHCTETLFPHTRTLPPDTPARYWVKSVQRRGEQAKGRWRSRTVRDQHSTAMLALELLKNTIEAARSQGKVSWSSRREKSIKGNLSHVQCIKSLGGDVEREGQDFASRLQPQFQQRPCLLCMGTLRLAIRGDAS